MMEKSNLQVYRTESELRDLARKRLQRGEVDLTHLGHQDMQVLVEELAIHRAELSVQNEELQTASDELATARDRYRDLFERAPVGYLTHDRAGQIREANQQATDLLGIPRAEPAGRLISAFLAPESQDAWFLHRRALASNSPRQVTELTLAPGADQQHMVRVETVPEAGSDPTEPLFRSALIDITQSKRHTQALEMAKQEKRRKDEFLALLGHELRNPLSPIANAAELLALKRDTLSREELDQIASTLSRQVNHMTRIVNELLDLSRIDRGRITLKREVVELKELVSQTIESVPALTEEGAYDFSVTLPETPLTVDGDPIRLVQVLTNLLDNATRYTPRGGWIRLEAGWEGEAVVLRIRDNGQGIDPDFLSRLFEPFERGRANQDTQIQGVGLGLPLVKQLVELHGGTVDAQSPGQGKGATFTLRLPVAVGETQKDSAPSGPSATAIRCGKILLVEDNEDVAGSLQLLLETRGQEVHRTATGAEAIEAVQASRPALVVIDLGLPDMSGFEVAQRLRYSLSGIPLVALSGYPASDFPDEPTEVFDDHLLKPPTLEALSQALTLMERS